MKRDVLRLFGYLGMFFFIGIIDRVTKAAALTWCGSLHKTSSFLSYQLALNRGVSFGLFDSDNEIVFFFVSTLIFIITMFFAWYSYKKWLAGDTIFGEVCVIAGSCSNIIDRLFYHGVIDFVLFFYNGFSFPLFNIADVAIVIGVCILLFQLYSGSKTVSAA